MPERSLEPIERPLSATQKVTEQITEAIVRGELEPGQRLVETAIADQLGVSRSPVREAFHQLEQLGLVEKQPYRGVTVSALTKDDVRELYTVRGPLEGLAAKLLALGDHEQAAADLREILDRMDEAATDGDAGRVMELNADFHDALISLTDHDLLQEMWSIVGNRMRRFLYLSKPRSDLSLPEIVPLHERIVRPIAEGDAEQAEFEARQHILRYVEKHNLLRD